jgi:2-C-methyl-D-erythritol 4-phosphate cytidylyltransferase / 2-C-methyl-D-erythritol 2,4-cyclodiphosphate synthase
MQVTAIIAAGGRGQRFGGTLPKQLLAVGGRAVLERSVAAFARHSAIAAIVVALPAEIAADPPAYLRDGAFNGKRVRLVVGGARRQDSVARAFEAVDERSDVIVIHDAARPFVSAALISATIAAAAESGAAVAAVPARDTVKIVAPQAPNDPSSALVVSSTVPRGSVYLAQTPQAFRRDVLRAALEVGRAGAGIDATDEASLAERAGHPVRIVEGETTNIKITTPADLPIAEAIAVGRASDRRPDVRIGVGYDLHRLVEARPLILGGVTVPFERGPAGHSDADVICHALTDAILGAACLGDIGRHFPDSDPRWKDASSLDLLRRAAGIAAEHGFAIGNLDVTVILEAPKIRDHVEAMRARVAGAAGVDAAQVSIKGKTNEGIDAIGRGEAIAAHAIALLRSAGPKTDD